MSRAVTLAGYLALVAAFVALEVRARRGGPPATAGAALRVLVRPPVVHLLVVAAWLWLGWHLFVRATRG